MKKYFLPAMALLLFGCQKVNSPDTKAKSNDCIGNSLNAFRSLDVATETLETGTKHR